MDMVYDGHHGTEAAMNGGEGTSTTTTEAVNDGPRTSAFHPPISHVM